MATEEGQVIGCHSAEEVEQHLQKALESKKLVVIDFTAAWSEVCREMAEFFAKTAKKMPQVVWLTVDVGDVQDVASTYKIMAMLTFVLLKDMKEIDRIVGKSKTILEAKVREYGTPTASS